MPGKRTAAVALGTGFMSVACAARTAWAEGLEPSVHVRGAEVTQAATRAVGTGGTWSALAWDDLERFPLAPGRYALRFQAAAGAGESLELPVCAGRGRIEVDGRDVQAPPGPTPAPLVPLAAGPHEVVVTVDVSGYEHRIACGERPRVGIAAATREGLSVLSFASPAAARGGGRAVVYLPPGRDPSAAGPLLVGLHPWNGSMWTYAAYAPLLREARARGVALLMPSGLGNSLYTEEAEDEVMRAIAACSSAVAVDPLAVSLWGASMGGAGATTIGLHRPDRFASITSFFGDSKYDLATYVHALLPTEAAAHLVNALDVADNARHVPVWLVHGEDDRTSPIQQSEMLAAALHERGLRVRFDRVPHEGHSGELVARFAPEVVATAAAARAPRHPSRVTYRSVRSSDVGAYGVRIVRLAPHGDAFVDVALGEDGVHVKRAEGVRAIVLDRGALGASPDSPPGIAIDDPHARGVDVRWGP